MMPQKKCENEPSPEAWRINRRLVRREHHEKCQNELPAGRGAGPCKKHNAKNAKTNSHHRA